MREITCHLGAINNGTLKVVTFEMDIDKLVNDFGSRRDLSLLKSHSFISHLYSYCNYKLFLVSI